jgi:hypothetical protein
MGFRDGGLGLGGDLMSTDPFNGLKRLNADAEYVLLSDVMRYIAEGNTAIAHLEQAMQALKTWAPTIHAALISEWKGKST